MLRIEHLEFQYGPKKVLNTFNWELEKGKIHGLVGLNGAGKTTLLHLLTGQLAIQSGTIRWGESALSAQQIGMMPAEPYFYPRMSGREYLQVFQLSNPSFDISGWESIFELPLDEWVETYSSGMQKQLSLLGVLALQKPLLLLDEPLRAVDVAHAEKMKYLFRQLGQKGQTLIITSHNLDALMDMADTISLLAGGQIVLQVEQAAFGELEQEVRALLTTQDQARIQELLA